MNELPLELVKALREGRCAIFVGAGASIAAGLPGWAELVTPLAEALQMKDVSASNIDSEMLLRIPGYYEIEKGRRELIRHVTEKIRPICERLRKSKLEEARPVHRRLAQLPTRLFYTTNFDTLLEDEFRRQDKDCIEIASESDARLHTERTGRELRKIHGSLDDFVLTPGDFARAVHERPAMFAGLADDLKSHSFLFVGYSLRDPDFAQIYQNVLVAMKDVPQRHFLALQSDPGHLETQYLRGSGFGIVPLWDYAGDRTQKTCAFLDQLIDATSEEVHIRRFFKGIEPDEEVKIIVTSQLHNSERYVLYPASDINTANQVASDLRKFGANSSIVADVHALRSPEMLRSENLILVCSPFGNQFTRYIFENASPSIFKHFVEIDGRRVICGANGRQFGGGGSKCPTPERMGSNRAVSKSLGKRQIHLHLRWALGPGDAGHRRVHLAKL